MGTVLMIDVSCIMKKIYYRMESPTYIKDRGIVQDYCREFAEQVLWFMYYYRPDEVMFAFDSKPYWRNDVTTNYYMEDIVCYIPKENPLEIIISFNKGVSFVKYNNIQKLNEWVQDKAFKKAQYDEMLNDLDSYYVFDKGVIPEEFKEKYGITEESNLWEHKNYAHLLKRSVPMYKGNRSEFSPSLFKSEDIHKVTRNLCEKLTYLVNGYCVSFPRAEADDVIARRVYNAEDDEHCVVCSSDSDLLQLNNSCNNFEMYDTHHNKSVTLTTVTSMVKIFYKILGGDSSDNIKGVLLNGKKSLLPTVSFFETGEIKTGKTTHKYVLDIIKNWVETDSDSEIWKKFWTKVDSDCSDNIEMLKKNKTLVHLSQIPANIKKGIDKAIDTGRSVDRTILDVSWQDFGITKAKKLEIGNSARVARYGEE